MPWVYSFVSHSSRKTYINLSFDMCLVARKSDFVSQKQHLTDQPVYPRSLKLHLNLLYSGNPQTGTFANSEDPDEMKHNAALKTI